MGFDAITVPTTFFGDAESVDRAAVEFSAQFAGG